MKKRNKRNLVKAYIRKYQSLSKKDQRFVRRFVCGALVIVIVSMALLAGGVSLFHNMSKTTVTVAEQTETKELKATPVTVETSEVQTEDTTQADVDAYNIDLLAHLVYAETGDNTEEAMIATASVVLNRVNSPAYPDSIEGVIFQEGQYASTWDGGFDQEVSDTAYNVAKYVYENGSQIPSNVVFQAMFTQGNGVYLESNGEYFCYA